MEVKEKETLETLTEEKTALITYKTYKTNHSDFFIISAILSIIIILILLTLYFTFTIINSQNNDIINGILIKGINVSGLSKEKAIEKVTNSINSLIPEEIILKHNDFETSISTANLEIEFNIKESVDIAHKIGRDSNIFQNNFIILNTLLSKQDIDLEFTINEENLKASLEDISSKLPDKIINNSAYLDGNNLVITKGTEGYIVDIEQTKNLIKDNISNLNLKNQNIEIIVEKQQPSEINMDALYNYFHKEPVNAYYTQNPYCVFPSENGCDFAISLNEAKNLLNENKDEYIIPLRVLYPDITTNMIGTEAFPNLLSDFSTKYAPSNKNRTTNLILAANKINGTVLMPGEIFSYNQTVGARTIEAGYKEAPIYVEGRVEDGLGGGICQITTTLYNAVLFANLEIVERSNHQFIPSYANASRDATVVYGAIDFKFKNNREYPIKITCSVANGIANFKILGLHDDNDYNVEITSRITKTTSSAIYSEAYKTLKKNGTIISTETISRDTYKRH